MIVPSLYKQIIISLLWSMPISMMMLSNPSGASSMFINVLRLIIPVIVFCILFGRMRSGCGAEFKKTRIVIASCLWAITWRYQAYHLYRYFRDLSFNISDESYGFYYGLIIVCYDVFAISMAVVFSYVVGKWVYKILNKLGNKSC
mgnify:CR=1 FL=1